MHPCFFQKTHTWRKLFWREKLTRVFLQQVWGHTYEAFTGVNTVFAIRLQFQDSQKQISLQHQSCVKTFLGHQEKRSGDSVQWALIALSIVTMIRWKDTVRWLPSNLFVLENSNTWPKLSLLWKEKWTRVFLWQVWGNNYPGFTGGIYCLFTQAPIPRFTKSCSPAVSKVCKDTPGTHSTISGAARSRECVLWVLTGIIVVTLIWWNGIFRWLPSKKWQAACLQNSNAWPKLLL